MTTTTATDKKRRDPADGRNGQAQEAELDEPLYDDDVTDDGDVEFDANELGD